MDYDLILSTYNPFYKVVFCSLPDRVIVGNSEFDQMTRFSRNNPWILKCDIKKKKDQERLRFTKKSKLS